MNDVREEVRTRYGDAASAVRERTFDAEALEVDDCCGSSGCCAGQAVFGPSLYEPGEQQDLPEEAVLASLGAAIPSP